MEVKFIQELHTRTPRDYMARMNDDKVKCAEMARKFGKDFFDGDRRYGYGGYKDDGRWKPMAKELIKKYKLGVGSKVLDIGCGKGYLINEIQKICYAEVWGCDISSYALHESPIARTFTYNAGTGMLANKYDLIISINTVHNLCLPQMKHAIEQIGMHSRDSYIVVESYRTVQELHNLQCWNLTGEQFLRPEEWKFLFDLFGYNGDYEFVFFD
jgi:SAM-dependent methyltransferase